MHVCAHARITLPITSGKPQGAVVTVNQSPTDFDLTEFHGRQHTNSYIDITGMKNNWFEWSTNKVKNY